jgi:hypothetical protein
LEKVEQVWEDRKVHFNGEVAYVTMPKLFFETLMAVWNLPFSEAVKMRVIWKIDEYGKPHIELQAPPAKVKKIG